MYLYDYSKGIWDFGSGHSFTYNGDDLTIDWPVLSGFEKYYDQNAWLTAKVDNFNNNWNIQISTILLTDQFSATFKRSVTAITDANGAYSFQNLPDGTYNLTLFNTNYADKIISGSLSPGQNISASSSLTTYTDTVFNTNNLNDGFIGYSYDESVKISGNKTPYSWTLSSGGLPSGLTLSASDGRIGGIPDTVGKSNFTIQIKGSDGIPCANICRNPGLAYPDNQGAGNPVQSTLFI
jgi:hypothetical protein